MDNTFIIDNLLNQEASETLEFKVDMPTDDIAKLVTSMLNMRGGDILLGVNKNKNVVGLKSRIDARLLLKNLMHDIRPSAPIDVQNIEYDGKQLLLVRVWEGSQKPYSYKGEIYHRMSNAHTSGISQIIKERKDADTNWERNPVLGADISDLDMEQLHNTMEMYRTDSSILNYGVEEFLVETGLMQNGNLTNACIVLYAKNPMRFVVQSGIRLSVFSSESPSDLVDSQNFDGNIFKNVNSIFQYIDNCYSKTYKIDDIHRTERWNYPRVAVREGIMNAIVHRDYNSYQGFLQIYIYPNHLDIANFGVTKPIVSLIELGNPAYSMLRNPDIAYHCYYRRLIEMRGTGIPRMFNDCKANGFDTPIYSVDDQIVSLTFPQLQLQTNLYSANKNDYESLLDKSFESLNIHVKKKMLAVLIEVAKQPGIKSMAIEKATGLPKKSIDRYLAELKRVGIICYKGSRKSGGLYIETKE